MRNPGPVCKMATVKRSREEFLMKRKKLLEVLADWLNMDEPKPRDQREELEQLLDKLKKKRAKLKKKLQQKHGKRKRKQLKMDLEIVRVQLTKGMHVLRKMKNS